MCAKRFSIRLGTIHQRPHLHPTIEAVVDYNVARLHASGHPVTTIKAVHAGPNASKASSGGLESTICLAHNAHIMITSNLWVDMQLPLLGSSSFPSRCSARTLTVLTTGPMGPISFSPLLESGFVLSHLQLIQLTLTLHAAQ